MGDDQRIHHMCIAQTVGWAGVVPFHIIVVPRKWYAEYFSLVLGREIFWGCGGAEMACLLFQGTWLFKSDAWRPVGNER